MYIYRYSVAVLMNIRRCEYICSTAGTITRLSAVIMMLTFAVQSSLKSVKISSLKTCFLYHRFNCYCHCPKRNGSDSEEHKPRISTSKESKENKQAGCVYDSNCFTDIECGIGGQCIGGRHGQCGKNE